QPRPGSRADGRLHARKMPLQKQIFLSPGYRFIEGKYPPPDEILLPHLDQPRESLVDEQDRAIGCPADREAERHGFNDLPQLPFMRPQRFLRLMGRRQIAHDRRINRRTVDHRPRYGSLGRKLRTVPAPSPDFGTPAHKAIFFLSCIESGDVLRMDVARSHRYEHVERFADRLMRLITEYALGLTIEDQNALPGIDRDHRIARRVQKRRELMLHRVRFIVAPLAHERQ